MINRRRLQADDPPPDLAIECDVTSKTTIEAYEAIEVPEVWIYDSGKLYIYLLQATKYVESEYSPLFPQIALTQIIPHAIALRLAWGEIERSWQIGSVAALEELEATIKKVDGD